LLLAITKRLLLKNSHALCAKRRSRKKANLTIIYRASSTRKQLLCIKKKSDLMRLLSSRSRRKIKNANKFPKKLRMKLRALISLKKVLRSLVRKQ
jgi:hypothetical protein